MLPMNSFFIRSHYPLAKNVPAYLTPPKVGLLKWMTLLDTFHFSTCTNQWKFVYYSFTIGNLGLIPIQLTNRRWWCMTSTHSFIYANVFTDLLICSFGLNTFTNLYIILPMFFLFFRMPPFNIISAFFAVCRSVSRSVQLIPAMHILSLPTFAS